MQFFLFILFLLKNYIMEPSETSSPSINDIRCKCKTGECSIFESEAYTAVREVAKYVKLFTVSDVLVRSPELIFFNLITLEDKHYCVELTQRGWRICSERIDCMYGDFRHPDLFAKYYESISQLLDDVSLGYRNSFAKDLTDKLEKINSS